MEGDKERETRDILINYLNSTLSKIQEIICEDKPSNEILEQLFSLQKEYYELLKEIEILYWSSDESYFTDEILMELSNTLYYLRNDIKQIRHKDLGVTKFLNSFFDEFYFWAQKLITIETQNCIFETEMESGRLDYYLLTFLLSRLQDTLDNEQNGVSIFRTVYIPQDRSFLVCMFDKFYSYLSHEVYAEHLKSITHVFALLKTEFRDNNYDTSRVMTILEEESDKLYLKIRSL